MVQIYVNGHGWLACKMSDCGIRHEQADNCFTMIGGLEGAQELSDKFQRIKWEKVLPIFAWMVKKTFFRKDTTGS